MYSDRLLIRLLNEQRLQAGLFMPRRLLARLSRSPAASIRSVCPPMLSSSSGAGWREASIAPKQVFASLASKGQSVCCPKCIGL